MKFLILVVFLSVFAIEARSEFIVPIENFKIQYKDSKYEKILNTRQCTDHFSCSTQFSITARNTANCQFDFIKKMCPESCKNCQ